MRSLLFSIAAIAMTALPASAQTLERVAETKQLNLGYRLDAAPLSYRMDDGQPAGYAPLVCVQVAQAIINHLKIPNLNAQFVPVDASDRFEKVASGEIDILCGAATITLGRRALVDFSIPIFVDGTSLVLQKDDPESLESFSGKKLGVRGNTTTEAALRNTLASIGIQAEVVVFDTHGAGMAAMESKEIDGYFADQSILAGLFFGSPKQADLKMSTEILTIEKQGLAIKRGDTEFRLVVDSALSELYANGEMLKIFQKAIPGVNPGLAMEAMYLIAPTVD
ncbi:amino acid ABC transporter substrate-binding protein [Shimia thalassica]|uniref:amino acid ABC transporter substrate-binding protein n=1 Tax=Shimia thalassica TaxID=1715693 RepID=UPI001C0A4041|nr:amino acid ABC transporter substrate-binding protein [Shimia thalassica]MBU2944976.1 amino acid ABC transporter substrate-binding protein [Shimia thalassica]MDO6504716.1 amino acid ABC transporter substrate-binding protein [Shimia thalassica]